MGYDPTIGRWIKEDPIGFTAADENLYRYVGNNPTNATDPSGLAAAPVYAPPQIEVYDVQGVKAGALQWRVYKPTPPAGLDLYTSINMKWQITKSSVPIRTNGDYVFWLRGVTAPDLLVFNLSPLHGAQKNFGAHLPPWPHLPTRTGLFAYLRRSFDLKGTVGRVNIVLEFRGYPTTRLPLLNPQLQSEKTGPVEFPTYMPYLKPEEQYLMPNRLRSSFRTLADWTDVEPDFWQRRPDWAHRTVLTVTWDWTGTSLVANYHLQSPHGTASGPVRQITSSE